MIVDYDELAHNENPALTGAIIANAGKMKPLHLSVNRNQELAILFKDVKSKDISESLSRNPGTANQVIENLNKHGITARYLGISINSGIIDYLVYRSKLDETFISVIADNPDPRLTKLIKDFAIKVIGQYNKTNFESYNIEIMSSLLTFLSANTNPELAEVIMMAPIWSNVSANPNTGLTKFIIDNEDKIEPHELSTNTNPELAYLIIKNIRKATLTLIAKNPNPGLTEFIKKYIDILDLDYLVQNPNPELAELIIANINKNNYSLVFSNSNPGLTKFILDAIANDPTIAIDTTISTAQH
jgi:hypothetical protein